MRALLLSLACVSLMSIPSVAKTPDGETPAEEVICDDYEGKAFGICNAYCEAMDCESDAPRASERACAVKEAQFLKVTGDEMPVCEADDEDPDPPGCSESFVEECAAIGGTAVFGPDGCECIAK